MTDSAAAAIRVAIHHPRTASRVRRIVADALRAGLVDLGHDAVLCDSSDAVIAHVPDIVLVVDPACPKLTDHWTIGFVWEPVATVERRTEWHRAMISWDLAVASDTAVRQFLRDMHFPARPAAAVSDLSPFLAPPPGMSLGDGALPSSVAVIRDTPVFEATGRERALFAAIAERISLQAYGPEAMWRFLSPAYGGSAPDTLTGAAAILARHQAVLAFGCEAEECLARLAVGLGRLAVTSAEVAPALPPGPGVLAVDLDHDVADVADRIVHLLAGAPTPASSSNTPSLGPQLVQLLDEATSLRRAAPVPSRGAISVIVRCGGRPITFVRRAVAAAARQTYPEIALVLVSYAESPALAALLAELNTDPRWVFVRSLSVPAGSRSDTLWAGLATIGTPLFCLLDDDDDWFHDHLATLAAALDADPLAVVAHSGTVKLEEGSVPPPPNAATPGERRSLLYLAPFDLGSALVLDHNIQSNAWLARSQVLQGPILDNPRLDYAEDLYLFLVIAAQGPTVFSGRATAVYTWRTGEAEASLSTPLEHRERLQARMLRRVVRLPFRTPVLGATLYRHSVTSQPATDPIGRRPLAYESALADGIDFARVGLPSFVAEITGLSHWEPWGRWSLGPCLRIVFRSALPDGFLLRLRARASAHNAGLEARITAGACTRQIAFTLDPDDVVLTFERTGGTAVLTLDIPDPRCPDASDSRPIGIGLEILAVLPLPRRQTRLSPGERLVRSLERLRR